MAYDIGATDADAFEAVLRSWCDRLAADAVDDLCIDVTTASARRDRLACLARSAREYALNLSVPPPPHATGFRIDPAYI